ncbi:hypothetical protein RHS03_09451, partial [Rhizoctonia solani]
MNIELKAATSKDFFEEITRWLAYHGEKPPLDLGDYPNPPDSLLPTNRPLKLQFGELRLITIATVQTNLLLLRSTVWRLYLVFGFHRVEQLPYFTYVPSVSSKDILIGLVDSINPNKEYIIDSVVESASRLKAAISETLEAEAVSGLLKNLYKIFRISDEHWRNILGESGLFCLRVYDSVIRLLNKVYSEETHIKQLDSEGNKHSDLTKDEKELLVELKARLGEISSPQDRHGENISPGPADDDFKAWCSSSPDCLMLDWDDAELGNDFLKALIDVAKSYRTSVPLRAYTPLDRLVRLALGCCQVSSKLMKAARLFMQGTTSSAKAKTHSSRINAELWGHLDFEKKATVDNTEIFDINSPGHVFGTTGRAQWLNGAIVHVEHLERPAGTTRAPIESYRIPSMLEFARICLHTGYGAPNTCYIGRLLSDSGDLNYDFVKVVDTVALACTSMFQLGSAECKIAMEGLKASDMVAYMRALRGHTLKNYRQCLSAAFNLNTPLVDDIHGTYHDKPIEIARRAIELTVLGGFDKVTWDDASDAYPSTPLLIISNNDNGLLSLCEAKELVYKAHSASLLAYFSAEFKEPHIKVAVQSGVDGIGIGGAQVLRNMDRDTGMHGDYMEWRIDGLIELRDTAADHVLGRAAKLLARLDQMYHEGSMNDPELRLRKELYRLLHVDDPVAEQIETDNPWIARASRLVNRRSDEGVESHPLLQMYGGDDWSTFEKTLTDIMKPLNGLDPGSNLNPVTMSVEGDIHSFSISAQWTKRLDAYRKWVKVNASDKRKHVKGYVDLNIKATPFEKKGSLALSDIFSSKDTTKKPNTKSL